MTTHASPRQKRGDNRPRHHEFALELERARREAGLNTKDLASKIFVGPRTVRRYLNGERLPTIETTEAWERACDIEPGRLSRMHPASAIGGAERDEVARSGSGWWGRRWVVLAALAAAVAAGLAVLGVTLLGGDPKSELERTVDRAKGLTATYSQRTGGPARTWSDFTIAGGQAGPSIGPRQTVRVTCRIRGFKVDSGNAWWYLLASPPWRNNYFATADAFYNQRRTQGVDFRKTRFVDPAVPLCP